MVLCRDNAGLLYIREGKAVSKCMGGAQFPVLDIAVYKYWFLNVRGQFTTLYSQNLTVYAQVSEHFSYFE